MAPLTAADGTAPKTPQSESARRHHSTLQMPLQRHRQLLSSQQSEETIMHKRLMH